MRGEGSQGPPSFSFQLRRFCILITEGSHVLANTAPYKSAAGSSAGRGVWGLLSSLEIGGLPVNRVVKGYLVLLEEIPQETEECLETHTQDFSAT